MKLETFNKILEKVGLKEKELTAQEIIDEIENGKKLIKN